MSENTRQICFCIIVLTLVKLQSVCVFSERRISDTQPDNTNEAVIGQDDKSEHDIYSEQNDEHDQAFNYDKIHNINPIDENGQIDNVEELNNNEEIIINNDELDNDEQFDNVDQIDNDGEENNDEDNVQANVFVYDASDIQSGFDLTDDEINKFHIWPEGVVPYYIDTLSYDKVLRDKIRSILFTISAQTGIRFKEYSTAPENEVKRWVMFINRRNQRDCQDYSINDFSNSGMQPVRIGYDCFAHGGNIAAAMLALLGVPAQHNSPDRNCFVNVLVENIMPDKLQLFQKLDDTEWMFHDLPYDFCSASHLALHRHSVMGKETMTLVRKERAPNCVVGKANKLSPIDVSKLKLLYNHITQKHRRTKINTECDRLFDKGRDLKTVQDIPKELPSAKKPNRYLGSGQQEQLSCEMIYEKQNRYIVKSPYQKLRLDINDQYLDVDQLDIVEDEYNSNGHNFGKTKVDDEYVNLHDEADE